MLRAFILSLITLSITLVGAIAFSEPHSITIEKTTREPTVKEQIDSLRRFGIYDTKENQPSIIEERAIKKDGENLRQRLGYFGILREQDPRETSPDIRRWWSKKNPSSKVATIPGLTPEYLNRCGEAAAWYHEVLTRDMGLLDLQRATKIYDAECLQNPFTPAQLSPELKVFYFSYIGLLTFEFSDGSSSRCAATRVAPQVLVTARHCVFNPNTHQMVNLASDPKPSFYLAADPNRAIPIKRLIHLGPYKTKPNIFDALDDSNDYILIETEPIPKAFTKVNFKQGNDTDPLLIMGYHDSVFTYELSHTGINGWDQAIRFDHMPLCAIVAHTGGQCFLHACQTRGGMSGAVLFQVADGLNSPNIIGIHTRELKEGDSKNNCSATDEQLARIPNGGISLPDDAIAEINKHQ